MLNWIVWLNWIAWNRNVFDNLTVLTFKQHAYATLNYLKWNCFLILKLYLHETELFNIELFWHLTVRKQNLYLYWTELTELELLDWTELLEIEMFFTIKLYLHLNYVLMQNWIVWNRSTFFYKNLVLNYRQMLICHKTQPNNQPTKQQKY